MDLTLIAVVLVFAMMLSLVARRQMATGAVDGPKKRRSEAIGEKRIGIAGIAVLTWFFGIFLVANVLADVPFLISVYGFGRVWHERLYIIERVAGGGPWFVSNGDRLVDGLHVHSFFAMAIFVGLIVVLIFLSSRYLARK